MSEQPPIFEEIKKTIDENNVVLFMKGTATFPQCGFSSAVAGLLDHLDIPFEGVNVLENMDIREGIKQYSDWPTIPQLYIKGEFIGGCDIVKEMYETGELTTLFAEKGITA